MPAIWPSAQNCSMSITAEIALILFTSMVKFAFSPLLSLQLGYSLSQTMVMIGIGGCMGVSVFYLGSGHILNWMEQRRLAAVASGDRKVRRNFTRANKMIVKVKRERGTIGLAAITPVLISIPIGSILAARYFRHDRRTLPVLLTSVLIWDVILSSIWNMVQ